MLSFQEWLEGIAPQDIADIKKINLPDSPYEIGMVDDEKTTGSIDRVQLKLQPAGEDEQHKLIVHTHPTKQGEEPSLFKALPSEQDLKTAIDAYKLGYPGIAIFSGPYFVIAEPQRDNISVIGYEQAVKDAAAKGDVNIAIQKLKMLGFEVETGQR